MMRPGLAQCDSVLQLRVGPKRRLVFERPRNGERATLWVDKHRVLQAHEGSWPICQNGDNSALRGLGMLLGSLGEVHAGCAKPIATTKS